MADRIDAVLSAWQGGTLALPSFTDDTGSFWKELVALGAVEPPTRPEDAELIAAYGETASAKEAARRCGIPRETARRRLKAAGVLLGRAPQAERWE
jgi:transcriptional regulator of acetoin/glycerol metabolism